jgi:hypothetical protein
MIPADDDFMGGIARRDFMNSASLRFIHRDQLESEGTASPAVEVAAAIPVKLWCAWSAMMCDASRLRKQASSRYTNQLRSAKDV